MWLTAEQRFVQHVCLRNQCLPFLFGNSKLPLHTRSRFPRAAARSTRSPLRLHHAHPFVATVEKNLSHAEKQRVWSRSCGLQDLLEDNTAIELWVVCVTFANLWTLVEIELLASVGWKWGCQPFSRPCSENAMRRRTEICSTCLSKESTPPIPFGNSNSKHPLPARSRFPRAAYTLPALHYACTMLAKDSI